MGTFARFVQAAHLLGRVLRHISDDSTTVRFQEQEAIQLHLALCALIKLSDPDDAGDVDFCSQIPICYRWGYFKKRRRGYEASA
jgi:hypothetical protein